MKGFLVMPFLCYYLQVHDCIIAILGSISGMEEELVFAFATKGWHMYFGLLMSGLRWRRPPSLAREKKIIFVFLYNYQRKSGDSNHLNSVQVCAEVPAR